MRYMASVSVNKEVNELLHADKWMICHKRVSGVQNGLIKEIWMRNFRYTNDIAKQKIAESSH